MESQAATQGGHAGSQLASCQDAQLLYTLRNSSPLTTSIGNTFGMEAMLQNKKALTLENKLLTSNENC
jgi:hypothetical protein